jgi:hypothetical protein
MQRPLYLLIIFIWFSVVYTGLIWHQPIDHWKKGISSATQIPFVAAASQNYKFMITCGFENNSDAGYYSSDHT